MEDGSEAALSQFPAVSDSATPVVNRHVDEPALPGIPETPPSDLPISDSSGKHHDSSPIRSRNVTESTPSRSQMNMSDVNPAFSRGYSSGQVTSPWDGWQDGPFTDDQRVTYDGSSRARGGGGFTNDIAFNLLYDSDDADSLDGGMQVVSPARGRLPPITPGSRSTIRRAKGERSTNPMPRKRSRLSTVIIPTLPPPTVAELRAHCTSAVSQRCATPSRSTATHWTSSAPQLGSFAHQKPLSSRRRIFRALTEHGESHGVPTPRVVRLHSTWMDLWFTSRLWRCHPTHPG